MVELTGTQDLEACDWDPPIPAWRSGVPSLFESTVPGGNIDPFAVAVPVREQTNICADHGPVRTTLNLLFSEFSMLAYPIYNCAFYGVRSQEIPLIYSTVFCVLRRCDWLESIEGNNVGNGNAGCASPTNSITTLKQSKNHPEWKKSIALRPRRAPPAY
ncbi:hypothetical protein P152DRAFT_486285 [Eremomyces bilateralis CBS 781.70]|uniref:Uncharacterized protein n=1 Tax=Eremomyces bilateralis CBS 781.70 TaxID=1392243 RepID=A0A6G1GFY2_9PEZI|nr:uncharacterized protein P152DRAFT_486285 [Eremomyces bilateralis CBS 781.70]KAF1816963.1 hypothetical protein P152DRAFT_486285 [Eremomyces bilateralis CBS 781.70]